MPGDFDPSSAVDLLRIAAIFRSRLYILRAKSIHLSIQCRLTLNFVSHFWGAKPLPVSTHHYPTDVVETTTSLGDEDDNTEEQLAQGRRSICVNGRSLRCGLCDQDRDGSQRFGRGLQLLDVLRHLRGELFPPRSPFTVDSACLPRHCQAGLPRLWSCSIASGPNDCRSMARTRQWTHGPFILNKAQRYCSPIAPFHAIRSSRNKVRVRLKGAAAVRLAGAH